MKKNKKRKKNKKETQPETFTIQFLKKVCAF